MKANTQHTRTPILIEPLELRISPATILVTTLADAGAGSLREAIATANGDAAEDVILFKKTGTIGLMTVLPAIVNDLKIQGGKKVTLDGKGATQIMSITGADTDVLLEGLKFTRGHAVVGGALLVDTATGDVVVRDAKFTKNVVTSDEDVTAKGGAIAILSGHLTVEKSTFDGNSARMTIDGTAAVGGAIFNAGTLTISAKTKFRGNTAVAAIARGGAIANDGTLSVDGAVFTKNGAFGMDGAKGDSGASGVNGTGTTQPGEDGGEGSGGESGTPGGTGGNGYGGAIYTSGTLNLVASKITGSVASGGNGGAGGKGGKGGNGGHGGPSYRDEYGETSPAGHRGAGGAGGSGAEGGGGGTGEGGAIWNELGGVITITASTLSKNTAKIGAGGKGGAAGAAGDGASAGGTGATGSPGPSATGGGIANFGTANLLAGTLVSKNTVIGTDASGGGIQNTGTLSLDHSTVSDNKVKAANGRAGDKGLRGQRGANGERGENGAPGEDGTDGGDGEGGSEGGNGNVGSVGGFARGGGIYNSGTTTLKQSTISGNTVQSGNGGDGGDGGDGGNGGSGGAGGRGGGAYRDEYGESTPAGHNGRHGATGFGGSGANGGDGGVAGDARGGGVFSGLSSTASIVVENSTISGNKVNAGAPGKAGAAGAAGSGHGGDGAGAKGQAGSKAAASTSEGGGIFSSDGSLRLTQSTIAKNKTSGSGGGVAVRGNLTTEIHNSTIAANQSAIAAGGLFAVLDAANDPVNVISTIIARNKSKTDADVSGTISASFSLVQNVGTAVLTGTSNVTGVDPKLKPLSLLGGPTKIMLPLAASPAIDKGSNPDALANDQRGTPFARSHGVKIDIGAVETA